MPFSVPSYAPHFLPTSVGLASSCAGADKSGINKSLYKNGTDT